MDEEAAKKKAEQDALNAKSEAEKLAAEKARFEAEAKAAKKKAEEAAAVKAKAELTAKLNKEKADADAARKKAALEASTPKKVEDVSPIIANTEVKKPDNKLDQSKIELESKYINAMVEGNNSFNSKNYLGAKDAFNRALSFKPNDANALEKLKLVELKEKKLLDDNTFKPPSDKIHPLVSKYPQGVTEETIVLKGVNIERRIVVKDKWAWVYTKKSFSWGGVSYFKDDLPITVEAYENDTR